MECELTDLLKQYQSKCFQDQHQKSSVSLLLLERIFTNDNIINVIKNQSPTLKEIFTYKNTKILISYLTHENIQHKNLIKQKKATKQQIKLWFKLPYMSMQILSCQCHYINDLLFLGGKNDGEYPLIQDLLNFLNFQKHYLLAGYFSKVICSITKRLFSPNYKYNSKFCQLIFGKSFNQGQNKQQIQQTNESIINHKDSGNQINKDNSNQKKSISQQSTIDRIQDKQKQTKQNIAKQATSQKKGYLFATISHLYSTCTTDYILKWLSLSGLTSLQNPKQINFYKIIKQEYLLTLIKLINTNKITYQYYNTIIIIFEQLLNSNEKSLKSNLKIGLDNLILKKSISKKSQNKINTYYLFTNKNIIQQVLHPIQDQQLNQGKIYLLKIFLNRYIQQLLEISKQQTQFHSSENLFIQSINSVQLMQVLQWIILILRKLLKLQINNYFIQLSNSVINKLLLNMLELLFIFHKIPSFRQSLLSYYNEHSSQLVQLIVSIMKTKNNLIQSAQNKIITDILKRRSDDRMIPTKFGRKMLIQGLVKIIDFDGIRQHVINWADKILQYEKQHVFQNSQQQSQWDHITQIIQQAKQIQIGTYKLKSSYIDCFFSEDKAKKMYIKFMMGFQTQVLYENKQIKRQIKFKHTKSKDQNQIICCKEQKQEKQQQFKQNFTLIDYTWYRQGYINFNVQSIMHEL